MKLLVDMNLSPSWVDRLARHVFEAVHWSTIGAPIADQLRVCRDFATRQGWKVVHEFTDHAVSGASLLRSGFQTLMRDALDGRIDVVLAEALDRFSRDQEDTAGLSSVSPLPASTSSPSPRVPSRTCTSA